MSNFTVSARKYRPDVFETVVGQEHVTNTLKNAIKKNHLGQAFLFCGPRGVGKTTCARILAKALNCENLSAEGEPCNECNSCQSFQKQQSFNIYELDAASNNSVDDIRSLVDQVRFAPQSGKYKIYIIDEVHMLSQAAFNAFLKTLEEPPAYAIFILATTERHKILPTILSRCQVFDFHRIGVKDIMMHLKNVCGKEGITAEDEALFVIAQKADGALRDALSIFDRIVSFSGENITYKDVIENLNILDYEYYFKAIDSILNKDLSQTLLLFDKVITNGFDAHNFLVGMSEHLRNLLVCKDAATLKLLEVTETVQSRFIEQSRKASLSFILTSLNILNQFDVNYKSSKNQRLHVELALMKLCHLPDAILLAQAVNENGLDMAAAAVQKKNHDTPTALKEEGQSNINSSFSSAETETASGVAEPAPVVSSGPTASSNPASAPIANNNANGAIKTAANVAGKSGVGFSLNLSKIKADVNAKIQEQQAVANAASQQNEDEEQEIIYEKVNTDKFKSAWAAYSQDLRDRGKISLGIVLAKKAPEFTEEGSVIIKVENDALKSQLLEDKLNLSDLLNKFGLFNIKIDFEVEHPTEEEEKKYITSDKQKFEEMMKINPAILDMQQRLGLRV